MALGLLDRCCSAETMMRFPAMYKMSQNRSDFNIKVRCSPSFFRGKEWISCCRSFGHGVWMQCIIRSFSISCPTRCCDMVGTPVSRSSSCFSLRFWGELASGWEEQRKWITYDLDVAHSDGTVFGSHLFLGNCVYTVNWDCSSSSCIVCSCLTNQT